MKPGFGDGLARRSGLAAGFLRKIDGLEAALFLLPEGFLPASGFKLALGHFAVELQRFILEQCHWDLPSPSPPVSNSP